MEQYLTTGGTADPFLLHLMEAIRGADQIDLAVAFIKSSGLSLIYEALEDAGNQGQTTNTRPDSSRDSSLILQFRASSGDTLFFLGTVLDSV